MAANDYLKMLEDIRIIFDTPLRFTRELDCRYPVGKLSELTIHFLHYESEAAASGAWTRRLSRFTRRQDRVFFKFSSAKISQGERFDRMPLAHKVFFTTKRTARQKCAVSVPREYGRLPDGDRLARLSPFYFDAWKWIETGDGRPSSLLGLRTV